MNTSLLRAFFVGRALAEALADQAQLSFTSALGEIGKFDAEQRERLRQFTTQVIQRAEYAEAQAAAQAHVTTADPGAPQSAEALSHTDIQAMLDDLRAEIAQLRAELKQPHNLPG